MEGTEKQSASTPKMRWWEQLMLYAGTVLGVYGSRWVRESDSSVVRTIWIAGFIALVIMPLIYKNFDFSPTTPFVVRFGFFVQNGVFWDVLMGGIDK